jgi:hypothetical protein
VIDPVVAIDLVVAEDLATPAAPALMVVAITLVVVMAALAEAEASEVAVN